MLILVDGIGFSNKGAEMMLQETVRRVRDNMPGASLAVSCQSGPYRARAELGLYQIPSYRRYCIDFGQAFRLLPVGARRKLGLVMNQEVGAVLDASGYRYASYWGPGQVRRLARRSVHSKQKGKKVVLLPQAFGPFRDDSSRYLRTVVENVDLLFARDDVSYDWITKAVGESPNVRVAPDFTLSLPSVLRARHKVFRGRSCIIPNRQMLDKGDAPTRDAYVPLMRACLRHLLNRDTNPFVLIHETHDENLAHQIVSGAVEGVDVVKESDCRAIKGIIGISGAVISSRYHGLVNALGQGVPALGTGWSHKYEMLFRDYGFEQGLIPIPTDAASLEVRLGMLTDDSTRERLIAQLRAAAERQRLAIEDMWTDVFALLKGS